MVKMILMTALFASSFAQASTLVCTDKDKYTNLSATVVNAESLTDINVSFFGFNDYVIDEAAQKDKTYKPTKYVGYSRFNFEGEDFEATQSLLLEGGFESKDSVKAVLLIKDRNSSKKPAMFDLSCIRK